MAEVTEDTERGERARLIPIRGLRGSQGQEAAATSAVLAIMAIIPEFSRALLRPVGAPARRPETFTEPSFTEPTGEGALQPDGLIRVTHGKKRWTALLEVKTGDSTLAQEQVEAYVRIANQEGFDAMITISNEFVSPSQPHPVPIPKKTLKNVRLVHWSWMHVLTTALALRRKKQVSDPEQAWLLDELIRFLDDERSGVALFDGFGVRWPAIRDAARQGTLHQGSAGVREFVMRWDQFLRHLSLRLSGELGINVQVVTSKKHREEPDRRTRAQLTQLVTERQLDGALRIPDAVADLDLSVYLHAQRIHASVTLKAPEAKKIPTSRINWLVWQLDNAPDDVQITAYFKGRKSTSMLLRDVRKDVKCLTLPDDHRSLPVRFDVAMDRPMGIKKGRGQRSFVDSVEDLLHDFYHDVVQDLKAWVPPAPRIEPADQKKTTEEKPDASLQPKESGEPTTSAALARPESQREFDRYGAGIARASIEPSTNSSG